MGVALACLVASAAHAVSLAGISGEISLGQIQHRFFAARDLRLHLAGTGGKLVLGDMEIDGQHWRGLTLACARLGLESGAFRCEGGTLRLPDGLSMALDLRQTGKRWRLQLQSEDAQRWDVRQEASGALRLSVKNGALALLARIVPQLAPLRDWQPAGRFSGEIRLAPHRDGQILSAELSLEGGAFNSPDASRAAENLAATLSVSGRERQGRWSLEGRLEWRGGAVYHAPLLIQADGQRLSFSGELSREGWMLREARLEWPRLGDVTLAGEGAWTGIREGRLTAALALAAVGEDLVQPLLASRALPALAFSGRMKARAEWESGRLAQLEIGLQESGLRLQERRFGLSGVTGRLDWRQEGAGEGEFLVGGATLGGVTSEAFPLSLAVWPKSFALARAVRIPILESELVIDHLTAGFNAEQEEMEGALGLSLHPMRLDLLTEALGLPLMQGQLAATLPTIRYANREAVLDGAMIIQVFDGYFYLNDLRLIEPFGNRSRVIADVEARHIDLEQLTQTFSFGQITGFVDAQLKGLELANTKPRAFTARIESSPGSYRKRISQRAVDHIAALGGGGAVAAIQKSALRFFQDFGYRRIGLSCRLENGICHMRGIDGMDGGTHYVIIEGGGIPALTVMGYSHRMDWEEFVKRLKMAIGNPEGPVIQ